MCNFDNRIPTAVDYSSEEDDPTAVRDEEEGPVHAAVAKNDIYNRIKDKRVPNNHTKTHIERTPGFARPTVGMIKRSLYSQNDE